MCEYDSLRRAFEGQDAVVHLAYTTPARNAESAGQWMGSHQDNLAGMSNAMEAASEADVESFVFASSNHVVGLYEREREPAIYSLDAEFTVDHQMPIRPDSPYAATKAFGEALGRYCAEEFGMRFYAIRFGGVLPAAYDYPAGGGERGLENGRWTTDDDSYRRRVLQYMCSWHSRRDAAHLVECCLRDDSVEFGVFHGVSDNDRRWLDIEHARSVLGYRPRDNAEDHGLPWSE